MATKSNGGHSGGSGVPRIRIALAARAAWQSPGTKVRDKGEVTGRWLYNRHTPLAEFAEAPATIDHKHPRARLTLACGNLVEGWPLRFHLHVRVSRKQGARPTRSARGWPNGNSRLQCSPRSKIRTSCMGVNHETDPEDQSWEGQQCPHSVTAVDA